MNDSYKTGLMRFFSKLYYAASIFKNVITGCGQKKCPCCGYEGAFDTTGNPPRYGALCPRCGSYERHRLLALSDNRYNFYTGKKVLHFAPEAVLERLITGKAKSYVTADLLEGRADRVINIEKIDDADNTWDVIVCSHVLEHVDDLKALSEMRRVLRDDGILIVMAPIIEGWQCTYENRNIQTGLSREEHFGQDDHVRYYGSDIRERISSQGFSIEEDTAYGEDAVTYGLLRGEKVFVCRKIKT